MDLSPYYGKTVTEFVHVTDTGNDRDHIRMTFADGSVVFGEPYGDCCAYTRIVEVAGVPGLERAPRELVSVEVKALGQVQLDYEYVDVFATLVQFTRNDTAMILCTCSHNGYYGGWIEWRAQAGQ